MGYKWADLTIFLPVELTNCMRGQGPIVGQRSELGPLVLKPRLTVTCCGEQGHQSHTHQAPATD